MTLDLDQLRTKIRENHEFIAIHYGSQSFFEANTEPIAVSGVAIHEIATSTTISFSRQDAPPTERADNEPETYVLRHFYDYLAAHPDATVIHWNMNRAEYGFEALGKRWRFLTGTEAPMAPHNSIDVDDLMKSVFGTDYAPHSRMESMANLNSMDTRSFKKGFEEAVLFNSGEWQTISRSTASKARIIGDLFSRLVAGDLRTANSAGRVEFSGARLDAVTVVLHLGEKYSDVLQQLSNRGRERAALVANDEYDDQYVIHALLSIFFSDIRPEEYTPSYAGGSSRIDFLLPEHGLALELKHTRSSLTSAEVGAQLLVDAARYRSNPNVTHLVALVIDLDRRLENPRGLERDLIRDNSDQDLAVTVRIIDR